jgi:hypothetical protein
LRQVRLADTGRAGDQDVSVHQQPFHNHLKYNLSHLVEKFWDINPVFLYFIYWRKYLFVR